MREDIERLEKGFLQVEARIRQLESLAPQGHIPADHPLALDLKQTGKNYSEATKGKPPAVHMLGAPHPHKGLVFLNFLCKPNPEAYKHPWQETMRRMLAAYMDPDSGEFPRPNADTQNRNPIDVC